MDRIRITGGQTLKGEIPISGAKNAALPLLASTLLTPEKVTFTNMPALADIKTLSKVLMQHGAEVENDGKGTLSVKAEEIPNTVAPYDLVRRMRASVLVLGPLLARFGNAVVSLPGGCAIGTRPVDLHLSGLEKLGAKIELGRGYIHASAEDGLKGGTVEFPIVSVGATENLLMAATLAKGETQLVNAAQEPEVVDLANCLVGMGAKIEGIGTDVLTITGVSELGGVDHRVVADRIEAGTYAIAAAITRGDVELTGVDPASFDSLLKLMEQAGVSVERKEDSVRVSANGDLVGVDAITDPYPGFPTDLQAQYMALMCTANGAAMLTETIFENRYMHVPELARMGANINVHGASAMIRGVDELYGAEVMATDLRASSSLVLAGLAAEGDTYVNRVYHLDRGYERLEEKLAACGADVERVPEEEPDE